MVLFNRTTLLFFLLTVIGLTVISIPSNLKLGMIYFNSYQYEKAYEYLNDVRSNDVKNVKALKKIRDYFLINGGTLKALEVQKQLVGLKPKNLSYRIDLEKLYDWNSMAYEKLLSMEKRIFLSKNENEEIKLILEIGNGFRWLRKYEDADRLYKLLEGRKIKNLQSIKEIADYYLVRKNTAKAIAILETLIDQGDVDSKYVGHLASAYEITGEKEKAVKQYLRILSGDSSFSKYYLKNGWISKISKERIFNHLEMIEHIIYHYSIEKRDELVSLLQVEFEILYPDRPSLTHAIAEGFLRAKNYKAAKSLYRKLEKAKIKREYYLFEVATKYEEMRYFHDAIRVFRKLSKINPRVEAYWENLAELYEEIGQKEKALKIYLRLLKIEKNRYQSSLQKKLLKGNLLVLNEIKQDLQGLSGRMENKHEGNFYKDRFKTKQDFKKKWRESRKRLGRIHRKIIDILGDIKDPNKIIPVYEELLSSSPDNIEILKSYGYALFGARRPKEARFQFEKIIKLNSNDLDAQKVLIMKYMEDKKYTSFLKSIEVLHKKNVVIDPFLLSAEEEALFQLKKSKHSKICQKYIREEKDNIELAQVRSRCLLRMGYKREAFEYMQRLLKKDPTNRDLRVQSIYIALDLKKIKFARRELERLKSIGYFEKENQAQWSYLLELEKEEQEQYAWGINTEHLYYKAKNYSFLRNRAFINKRISKIKIGLITERVDALSGTNQSYHSSGIRGVWESFKHRVELSSLFFHEYKNKGPNFRAFYQLFDNKNYLSVLGGLNSPEYGSADLLNEKTARADKLELFLLKTVRSAEAELFTGFRKYYFLLDSGNYFFFAPQYLHSLKVWNELFGGIGLYYGSLAAKGRVKELYINKNLSYYAVAKWQRAFLRSRGENLRLILRLKIGGDLERTLSFGKLIDGLLQIDKVYGSNKSINFSFNYLHESSVIGNGSSTIITDFKWSHWF